MTLPRLVQSSNHAQKFPQTKKIPPWFLFLFTFLFTLLFSLSWVSAQEQHKPKPQPWQIDGIVAALDDSYPKVKQSALQKLAEYQPQDLKPPVVKKPEDIAQKAANILKDETVDPGVRGAAVAALGNLGADGAKYVPDIANILKDRKVNPFVRSRAAAALGNLGAAGAKYVPDILNILKDGKFDPFVRGAAVAALSNLGADGAKYVPDILNILKDETVDSFVRGDLAAALGNLGETGVKYVPDILNILKDETVDPFVRGNAAKALGNLGETGVKYVPDIANIFKDETVDADVRGAAAAALGNLGAAGAKYVPDILNFLKDDKVAVNVRGNAAKALGNLGADGAKYVPDILNILKDETVDPFVRGNAAKALGNLGETGVKYVPDIANFLKDETVDADVRGAAAAALGNLGAAGAKYVPDIANFLKDGKVDPFVRGDLAAALGNLGAAGAKYVPDILNFLKDDKVAVNVRSNAAAALGNLGAAGAKYVPDILNFLKDETNAGVRGDLAAALGNLGAAGAKYVPDILNFLKDDKVAVNVRGAAAAALGNIRKLELDEVVVALNNVYVPNQTQYEDWRFLTYFLGGSTDEVKTLLKWLGYSQTVPTQLNRDEGVKTLQVFLKAWQGSNGLERLRADLAKQIAVVAGKVSWQQQDIRLLQNHLHNLEKEKGKYNETYSVQSVIANLKGRQWLVDARNIILIHIAFWLALIFAYPKSPQVQAIFFWNPWVRRIVGAVYVGFLLTWVPFLRCKLFEPFKPSLLADAGLDNFDSQAYFPESTVRLPRSGETLAIIEALPSIKGQIVLVGDSGLGKSIFMRQLVKNSQRIAVYLPAHKCDKGIIEAIQAKLHGQAQDTEFLKSLIYSGAIDICIDGLNEVTADTRVGITQFVEKYFRGNIIMTTQPLEWNPPSTAKMYELQPLLSEQIEKFLISRQRRMPKDAKVQGADYEQACKHYLAETLKKQQSSDEDPKELTAAQRILSNPMDLTLVALMLSQGKRPDLFHLQEQQYHMMAEEYQPMWKREFPLKRFSKAVYQMRLNDEKALPADEFRTELEVMEDEKYKMVVSRQWKDAKGEDKKEWNFRHDKITDFFLVQNFLGDSNETESRLIDHMSDPRFRGVYFLLATLLPPEAAQELREKLIQYAADTKDHTVSDTFVQLLRST